MHTNPHLFLFWLSLLISDLTDISYCIYIVVVTRSSVAPDVIH